MPRLISPPSPPSDMHLHYDAEEWALDVQAGLAIAHRVLLRSDDVDAETAWRWFDTAVDHGDARAGSRPPVTPEEVAEARREFSKLCNDDFGWSDQREARRQQADREAEEARREAAIDRDVQEEADAKRSGTWGVW